MGVGFGGVVGERRRGRVLCRVARRRRGGPPAARYSTLLGHRGRPVGQVDASRAPLTWTRTGLRGRAAVPRRGGRPASPAIRGARSGAALVIMCVWVHGPMVSATRHAALAQTAVLRRASARGTGPASRRAAAPGSRVRSSAAVQLQRCPERVVVLGMLEPGLAPRRAGAEQRPAGLADAAAAAALGPPARRDRAWRRWRRSRRGSSWWATMSLQPRKSLSPNEPVPQRGPLKSCGPTVMTAAFISGGGSVQQRPLGEAEVGQPDGGERAGEPRLVAQPGGGVGAVGDLVDERVERRRRSRTCRARSAGSRGSRAAAYTAAYSAENGKLRPYGQRTSSVPAGFDVSGNVVVGDQFDTVAHRDPHAAVHAGRRAWAAAPAAPCSVRGVPGPESRGRIRWWSGPRAKSPSQATQWAVGRRRRWSRPPCPCSQVTAPVASSSVSSHAPTSRS